MSFIVGGGSGSVRGIFVNGEFTLECSGERVRIGDSTIDGDVSAWSHRSWSSCVLASPNVGEEHSGLNFRLSRAGSLAVPLLYGVSPCRVING